jgi:hypothetical protein
MTTLLIIVLVWPFVSLAVGLFLGRVAEGN